MPSSKNEPNDRSRLGSVFSSLARWFRRKHHEPAAIIVANDTGFDLTVGSEIRWSLRWSDVAQIVAYKRDLYTTDLICIGFVMRGDRDHIWSIHEELEGYKLIQDALDLLTDGAWPAGFSDVAYPAFETNFTVLWTAEGEMGAIEDPWFVWAYAPPRPATD